MSAFAHASAALVPAQRGIDADSPLALHADACNDFSQRIAALAQDCLHLEVATWPKPGLVSHIDNGSHDDMDAAMFLRSAAAIAPYFAELADAGACGAAMPALRRIGLRAEVAMLRATGGVNTHRGAIFGLGLLCAAAGAREAAGVVCGETLGTIVARCWGADILAGPRLCASHGERARQQYGAGGARVEAARGFPNVYQVGIRALRHARRLAPGDVEAQRVHACLALIAATDDTNLLHRGGRDGLEFAQASARAFLERGGIAQADWRSAAAMIHTAFVARRLSPGGAADLLAMSLFVDRLDREGDIGELPR